MSHRYFASQIQGDTALLLGEEAAHVARVLRCKPGEELLLFDGSGSEYDAEIVEITPQQVRLAIRARRAATTEPGVAVTLYVGLPKGDKLELIVQKATELGAARVVPFESRFCVAKMKNEAAKLERWARIAKEAAKQSGRAQVPEVLPALAFDAMCRQAATADVALFCYERGGDALAPGSALHTRLATAKTVAIITGAEGGFDEQEAAQAVAAGCTQVGLGPRILRCETAPLAALAAVMVLTGNLC